MSQPEDNDPVLKFAEEVIGDCPFDHSNPRDCPLHEMRVGSVADRQAFIRSLPKEALEDLVVYHWLCMEAKILARAGVA